MPRRLPRRRSLGWSVLLTLVGLVLLRLAIDRWRPAAPDVLAEGVYRVSTVFDGDTFRLANGAKVRLIGVDAPETRPVPQPWAEEATAFTRHFLRDGQVRLTFDRERLDRFDRFLAYADVDDRLLNEALVLEGLARARTDFHYNQRYKRLFRQAEAEARQAGRGMWSGRGRE